MTSRAPSTNYRFHMNTLIVMAGAYSFCKGALAQGRHRSQNLNNIIPLKAFNMLVRSQETIQKMKKIATDMLNSSSVLQQIILNSLTRVCIVLSDQFCSRHRF